MPGRKQHPHSFRQVGGSPTGFRTAVTLDSTRGAIKLDNQWSNIEFSLFAEPGESKQKRQAQHEAMIQSLKEGAAEQIQVVVDTRKRGFSWLFPGLC